jgi:hypothetical protein
MDSNAFNKWYERCWRFFAIASDLDIPGTILTSVAAIKEAKVISDRTGSVEGVVDGTNHQPKYMLLPQIRRQKL